MKIDKYFRVIDGNGRVRFESIFCVDSQFFLKRLLQRTKPGQKKPTIVEIPR